MTLCRRKKSTRVDHPPHKVALLFRHFPPRRSSNVSLPVGMNLGGRLVTATRIRAWDRPRCANWRRGRMGETARKRNVTRRKGKRKKSFVNLT